MSGEKAITYVLKLNDQGSAAAEKAISRVTKAVKETGEVVKGSSQAAISAFQKMASAREVLGIRSEKAIQNEIALTEAAYKRMAASGQASARELGRAQDAMRGKVAELRREMEGVKQSAGGIPTAMKVAMGAVGAYQAGKMMLAGPVGQTMAYDRSLANLSNTAYAGQSMDARRAGMRTLDAAISSAVRLGGGTREGALGTLDKLVASGAFSDVGEATQVLPTLTRGATAANADPSQLADIAIRAKQTFGITDMSLALDQAMMAGQKGGFELRDMAKWLPQQMAAARQSGLYGESGFRTLLAANQAAVITAGTKDEAGNNLVNLLAKINSQDTANDAKKQGINLSGSLSAARAKGVNSLDAFVNLTEQLVGKDPRYAALRAKAKNATGDEQRDTYNSMGDIVQGSAIGKIIQDRQALMALIGIMNNRGYMEGIRGNLSGAKGTIDDAHALIDETPSYKAEQLAADKAITMQVALDKVNPVLGSLAEGLSSVMREWPGFSASIIGATTGLAALAAAAGAAALPTLLSQGGLSGTGATVSSVAARAAAGLGPLAVATAPLGAMWGVSAWAESTEQPGEAEKVVSRMQNSPLSKFLGYLGMNRDGDIEARRAQNRSELGGDSRTVIENKIILDGRQIAESVNEHNARSGSRN